MATQAPTAPDAILSQYLPPPAEDSPRPGLAPSGDIPEMPGTGEPGRRWDVTSQRFVPAPRQSNRAIAGNLAGLVEQMDARLPNTRLIDVHPLNTRVARATGEAEVQPSMLVDSGSRAAVPGINFSGNVILQAERMRVGDRVDAMPLAGSQPPSGSGSGKGKGKHPPRLSTLNRRAQDTNNQIVATNLHDILYQQRPQRADNEGRYVDDERPPQRAGPRMPVLGHNPNLLRTPYQSVFSQTNLTVPEGNSYTNVMSNMDWLNATNLTRMQAEGQTRQRFVEPWYANPGFPNATQQMSASRRAAALTAWQDELNSATSEESEGMPALINSRNTSPRPVQRFPTVVNHFRGDEPTCHICQEEYTHNTVCIRNQCRHSFHAMCWERWINGGHDDCPLCRCSADVVSRYNYIDHAIITQLQPSGSQTANLLTVEVGMQYSPRELDVEAGPSPSGEASAAASTHTTPQSEATGNTAQQFTVVTPVHASPAFSPLVSPRGVTGSEPASSETVFVTFGETLGDTKSWVGESIRQNVTDSNPPRWTLESTLDQQVGSIVPAVGTILNRLAEDPNMSVAYDHAFHTETRMTQGRHGLLVDSGSLGNLGSDAWSVDVGRTSMEHGRIPAEVRRDRVLSVSGVGKGAEKCRYNVKLPVCFAREDGVFTSGTFETPCVKDSYLPGILGLTSMANRRGVLDMVTNKLHFLGPGDYDLAPALPAGTETFQLTVAPSGHLLLPCDHYQDFDNQQTAGNLTLDSSVMALHSNPITVEPVTTEQ